jgi:hypothetical protein
LAPDKREHNRGALADFPYDTVYPFTNIYSEVRPGYGGDIVSFAGGFKSLDDEWNEWEARFEELLFRLYGRSVQVHLEHETDGLIKTVGYLCKDGWDATKALSDRSWIKWYYDKNGTESDEVPVISIK